MALTGVRARRVDGAEVKLDTVFYKLRDRFFGSRVGSRAFNAVAFSLGTNRGMVCGTVSWFQLRMRLWRGKRCVQPKGRRKGFRMSCCRVHSVESAAYARTQREQIQLGAWPPPARTSRPKHQRRTGGTVRGGLFERRRQFACWQRAGIISFALLPWSMQPKSTRRECGDPHSRARQSSHRCDAAEAAFEPAKHLCGPESA